MFGKIAILSLVLVVGLAAVGLGFAGWSQELFINGTVNTGSVDMEFQNCRAVQANGMNNAETTVNCLDLNGDGMAETMQVNIQGAFPGHVAAVLFDVHCSGSVPVHISEILITEPGDNVEVSISGIAVGDQIHPCESVPATLTARVNTNQAGQYGFSVRITAVNWSETTMTQEGGGS